VTEINPKRTGQNQRRKVSILGATGSVGCNTIDLIQANQDLYDVVVISANSNVALLAEQARALNADIAVIADESRYDDLKAALVGTKTEAAAGGTALNEAAALPTDWVMAAIVGAAGLAPTLAAVRNSAMVALANKECLVCAGELMLNEVTASGSRLLPVDSEHNAIFQVFDFEQPDKVEKIILTASGGPFLDSDLASMAKATPAQAVAHPNWDMGAKISVDSATMMNKGLELIEAFHLFPVSIEQLEVLIHPQSVVHSLVAYRDGSVLAQMGAPDMRIPIAYTLAWPDRMQTMSPRLDLARIGSLTFRQPDNKQFPALALAREALRAGGAAPTVLNAANEVAVAAFLAEEIGFLRIAAVVAEVLNRYCPPAPQTLDDVFAIDREARNQASTVITPAKP